MTASSSWHPARRPVIRVYLLLLLLATEVVAVSEWLDTSRLRRGGLIVSMVAEWGSTGLRAAVAFALIWVVFGRSRGGNRGVFAELEGRPLGLPFAPLHALAAAVFVWLSVRLYGAGESGDGWGAAWIAAGILAAVTAALLFVPWRTWWRLLRGASDIWLFALGLTAVAIPVSNFAQGLWSASRSFTFSAVCALADPFLSEFHSDPAQFIIGTPRFQVGISHMCGGLEGIGLVLVFGAAWLWFFRQDYRFPASLLLLPAGAVTMYALNAVRLAALLAIGDAGYREVAEIGFHSQAGWISFVCVSLAICWASRRVAWFGKSVGAAAVAAEEDSSPWNVPWLAPFVAILAAAMVSRALSGSFEWLYPLRVAAAAGALWWGRAEYRKLDWSVSGAAAAAGIAVFALWVGMEWLRPHPPDAAVLTGLAQLGAAGRIAWLAARVAGSAVTVPLAEELAFRGFLFRRLVSADFVAVDPRRATAWAWVASSAAFGFLHGDRWPIAMLAGAAFAWAYSRRGSIGDAAAAHAIANALLSAWVLATGQTQLW